MEQTTPQTKPAEKPEADRRPLMLAAFLVIILGGGIAATAYLLTSSKDVYIENAQIAAPMTDLTPTTPGILQNVDVSVGDVILPNTQVATVGTQVITSTGGGLVIATDDNIGQLVNPGDAVVTTIDPTQLRVVGQLEEDKGLASVEPGQRAEFTVDAFGGEKFQGVVDEVSPTSQASDVVFNVSDKREEQDFDVKVRFDTTQYPQLKNGMSAKIWVYKQ